MNPGEVIGAGALWVAVPLAVLAGLLSFVSPCILPLVPGYLGFVAGAVTPRPVRERHPVPEPHSVPEPVEGPAPDRHPVPEPVEGRSQPGGPSTATVMAAVVAPSRGRLVGGVLLFVAGFTVVFVSATLLGGALGDFLIAYRDVITRVLGAVVILLGLVFIGVSGFGQRTLRVGVRGDLGLVGAPLLGIALGIGWTPCIGPTLAAITAVSWNVGDPARAVLLGLAYSAGLGIPFVLIAAGVGWASRSVAFVRRHIRAFNIAGGVVLVVLGLLMLTGVWSALMSLVQVAVAGVPLPL